MFNFANVQRHFKNNTGPYLWLPSCRETKTASEKKKRLKNQLKKQLVFVRKRYKLSVFGYFSKNFVMDDDSDDVIVCLNYHRVIR